MGDSIQRVSGWIPRERGDVDPRMINIVNSFIKKVPNLPVHVHKLLEIVSDEKSEAIDIANAASADPGLVSKILKVINSSYYGLSKPTDNIHFAIVLLGFNEVRKIALQTSFSGTFNEGSGKDIYDTKGLWSHSYLVSICAESLGRSKDANTAGELLTFGILHDVGKFALFKLAIAMKEKGIAPYKSVDQLDEPCIMEKEEALFKISHPIVGSMLAKKWDLSDRVCNVLEYHHHPSFRGIDTIPEENLKDVALISIADAIVNRITGDIGHPDPRPEYFDIVGLAPSIEALIDDELQEKLEDAKSFMSHMG